MALSGLVQQLLALTEFVISSRPRLAIGNVLFLWVYFVIIEHLVLGYVSSTMLIQCLRAEIIIYRTHIQLGGNPQQGPRAKAFVVLNSIMSLL